MTREDFENMSFRELIDYAYDNGLDIYHEETVVDMVRAALNDDNWVLADHLLHFIVNMDAEYIYWEPSMGTMQEPVEINDENDIIEIIDEAGLIEESLKPRRKNRMSNESAKNRRNRRR